jgi:putative glycosyltransferase (TIGR04372 family)
LKNNGFLSMKIPYVLNPILHPERLGHLVTEIEIHEAERKLGLSLEFPGASQGYYFPKMIHLDGLGMVPREGKLANRLLVELWSKLINICHEEKLAEFLSKSAPHLADILVTVPRGYPYMDFYGALDRVPPSIQLTPDIIAKGEAYLRSLEIKVGDKIICFHYRQPNYISAIYGDIGTGFERDKYSYRNVASEPYDLAVAWLCEQGYYVIRMGKEGEPWPFKHPRAFDYAFNSHEEALDLYLFAQCQFYLGGSNSGTFGYAELFRKPILFTNFYTFKHIYNYSPRYLTIFQRPVNRQTGQLIPVAEVLFTPGADEIHQSLFKTSWDLRQNTAEEILEAVQEMTRRVEGSWMEGTSDRVRQLRFMQLLHTSRLFPQTAWGGRVGAKFLKKIDIEEGGIPLFRK